MLWKEQLAFSMVRVYAGWCFQPYRKLRNVILLIASPRK